MKIHNYVLAGVLSLLAATSLLAQSQHLQATIPFDFYVAEKLLPAGTYTIIPSSTGDVIQVRGSSGNAAFVLMKGYANGHSSAINHLVFRKYGTASFLTSVHWMGYQSTRMLVTAKMEQELARINGSPAATATVAAKIGR